MAGRVVLSRDERERDRVDELLATLARYIGILRGLSEIPLADYQADPRNFGSAECFLEARRQGEVAQS